MNNTNLSFKNIIKKKGELREFLKKIWKILLITLLIMLISIGSIIGVYKIKKEITFNKVKDKIISEMNIIEILNRQNLNTSGEKKAVEGFNLEKDTLPFKNFRTLKSLGGNCEGYSMYELLRFEGKLEEFLGDEMNSKNNIENLYDIELSKKDIENIYLVCKNDKALQYVDYIELEEEINYEEILKKAYGLKSSEDKKAEEDFNNRDFENEELKNILKDISFLHSNKGYTRYISEYYNPNDPSLELEDSGNKYAGGDINFIKERIDNNKLIEIGISNNASGHALLGYAYEKIDLNNYKVYVKDSNLPLIKKDTLTTEDIKINDEIKNLYVYFTKDILKDEWSYIYQPIINGVELYGYYNSFVPGTKLSIYSTGL